MKPDRQGPCAPGSRRNFLRSASGALVAAGMTGLLPGCLRSPAAERQTRILVPEGFEPRIVARSGYPSCARAAYRWHSDPDGGACFDAGDGGWIYLSNCETRSSGGVSALRFDAGGAVTDSYRVLGGSNMNCSGGPTPWGTWLSCEEHAHGRIWECDPFNDRPARAWSGLGLFEHESVCVDPLTRQIYLTEDRRSGRLYRFTPGGSLTDVAPDLDSGLLQVAVVSGNRVDWRTIRDPTASQKPVRKQVMASTRFAGGEGIDIFGRFVRFTTKYDNRIWQIDLRDDSIRVIHRLAGVMQDVDDLTHTPGGGYLVAEDGPQMRILYFSGAGSVPLTLVQLPEHRESEITGLAFAPGGTRLYFSSQRGSTGVGKHGITFELHGDFGRLRPGMAMREWIIDHGQIGTGGLWPIEV